MNKKLTAKKNKGNASSDFWIYTEKIPKFGVRGVKVKPIHFGSETDHYFGFGVIERSEIESSHGYYICFSHRNGKLLDMRYGNVSGYNKTSECFENYQNYRSDYEVL